CEASLRALETDRIDLYQYHRPDPDVPYAETIGAFKELQDEGKVRWIWLSVEASESQSWTPAALLCVRYSKSLLATVMLTKVLLPGIRRC
ncbi:MAG: aldo/keto reductase, partial [Woeseiaceae bacterium]|nr:aldo/keto reductase [Woeseiaceae bacterium]